MRRMAFWLVVFTLAAFTLAAFVLRDVECAAHPQSGRAVLVIHWPAESRLIPAAAKSIRVSILNGLSAMASRSK